MSDVEMLPIGCGYQGYEFGANYLDSLCCGGRLYDCDNCDSDGNLYEPGDYIPCPNCNFKAAVSRVVENVWSEGNHRNRKLLINETRRKIRRYLISNGYAEASDD